MNSPNFQSVNCTDDQVLLSRSGDPLLTGARAYCGEQQFKAISNERSISFGLIITESSRGGYISCELSAQRVPYVAKRVPARCRCGERKQTNIVGGEEARINEFTMMAGLIQNIDNSIHCGAATLSARHVMTAAHCVAKYVWNIDALSVIVGIHYVEMIPKNKKHKIFRFIIHEKFNEDNHDFDIALVVLKRKIMLNDYVLPVCLPFKYQDTDLTGKTVTILGWGTIWPGGPKSDVLKKVDVKVVDQEMCRATVGNITDRQICTFARAKDACQYDSGGPVLLSDPKTGLLMVVGVVSKGVLCGTALPSTNARVSSLLPWIQKYARGHLCRK